MSNNLALCALALISIMVTSFTVGLHMSRQNRSVQPFHYQKRGTSTSSAFQKRLPAGLRSLQPSSAFQKSAKPSFQKRVSSPSPGFQKRGVRFTPGPEAMASRVKSAIYFGYPRGKNGSLPKFQAAARYNRWDMIGYATGYQFDWWVFPTPRSGLYKEFRVPTDRLQQGRFYRSLLNDRRYVDQFLEMLNYVALSWGWDLWNNRDVQNKTKSQNRPVYALRYYKMLKCLALMNRYASRQNKLWIQKFYNSMTTGVTIPKRGSGIFQTVRRFDNTIGRPEWKIIHSQYGINNRDWFGID